MSTASARQDFRNGGDLDLAAVQDRVAVLDRAAAAHLHVPAFGRGTS
jgi:hypothetical protein